MLFIAYSTIFSCFGIWDLMCEYHQHRVGQRDPTLVGHAHGPVSWKDLAYILPSSWQDHGNIVLPHVKLLLCPFPMV